MTTWFERLFGFVEGPYEETRARFTLEGEQLTSMANGRSFGVGRWSRPSLAELRERAEGKRPGALCVTHEVVGDALELHALEDNAGALFQVASQFNCLEFAGPEELPEHGVTPYADDPTQGPACSLAAGAATVFRNYLLPMGEGRGQRAERQLNNLAGVLERLGGEGRHVDVKNGYTFSDAARLEALNAAIANVEREEQLSALRIGLQQDVEVTFASRFVEPAHPQRVSQAFCSALSCGYTGGSKALWAPLAKLVLDAAYEATLLAAVLDAEEGRGSGRVWLTFLGGGAFGNDRRWIADAMERALGRLRGRRLDVRIAHHRQLDPTFSGLG